MELFKDGLNEGEGVGVGINFQQKIICGLCSEVGGGRHLFRKENHVY
jgi:hypothetical protein